MSTLTKKPSQQTGYRAYTDQGQARQKGQRHGNLASRVEFGVQAHKAAYDKEYDTEAIKDNLHKILSHFNFIIANEKAIA